MTGYKSKKAAALDKLEQWDTPSKAFNEWWDSDYNDSANPFEQDSAAYWAWAGWQAAQPVQEQNFCPRCGKRTRDLTTIHTCTPPHA